MTAYYNTHNNVDALKSPTITSEQLSYISWGQSTDLLFPNSITVEGFAPCGLFYTPIQQMTFFFPL